MKPSMFTRLILTMICILNALFTAIEVVHSQKKQPVPTKQGELAPITSEDLMRQIVMIKCQIGDGESFGAGIIFGKGSNRLYIVTANHIVRRGTDEAQKVRILLRWLPGEWKAAELLENTDRDLDLAVLAIDLSKEGVDVGALRWDQLGDVRSLKSGDSVYSLGYPKGEPWHTYVTPDRFSKNSRDSIFFESNFIGPGNSGGALLNEKREILGMITEFDVPNGSAVSIQSVLDVLKDWTYPVNLTVKSTGITATGGGPTPQPSPPNSTSQTDASPAVTGVGNAVYFFAKTPEGRVMYDWAELGKGGHGWKEVDGNARTDDAPSAGAVGTHVFVAIKGRDGHVYINQADLGHPFNDQWSQSGPVTDAAPAVTGVGNAIYFFAKTPDGRIMYDWAELGKGGHGWKEVDGNARTDTAPGAGGVGNHVFVAIKGLGGYVYFNQADLGRPFNDHWSRSELVTDTAPAAAGVGNYIYFFAKTPDGKIMYDQAELGKGWNGWREVEGEGRTDAAPGAGAIGPHVFVAIKTRDGRVVVNQTDLGRPFGQWF